MEFDITVCHDAEINHISQLKKTLTLLHEVDGVVGARRAGR